MTEREGKQGKEADNGEVRAKLTQVFPGTLLNKTSLLERAGFGRSIARQGNCAKCFF